MKPGAIYEDIGNEVITVDEFVKRAGWQENWSELDLQTYLIARLKSMGYKVEDEVWVGRRQTGKAGRMDVVATRTSTTPDGKQSINKKMMIECKKIGTRNNLFQASGQMHSYKTYVPDATEYIIACMYPDNPSTWKESESAASFIKESTGVITVFLNAHPQFIPNGASIDENDLTVFQIFVKFLEAVNQKGWDLWNLFKNRDRRHPKSTKRPWQVIQHLWDEKGENSYSTTPKYVYRNGKQYYVKNQHRTTQAPTQGVSRKVRTNHKLQLIDLIQILAILLLIIVIWF